MKKRGCSLRGLSHRCARSVCCVACAVSWVTWLLFTGALARCVALCARCPGPLGSCSPVCQDVVSRPSVALGARACAVSWPSWRPFTGVRTVCGARVPLVVVSVFPPPYLSFFFFLTEKKEKRGRAYTAGTGTGSWCGGAIVLCLLACVVGVVAAVAPQGCGSRVLMCTGMSQGGFG